MSSAERLRITPRLIIGLGILTLGVLWTLDNMNFLESEPITRWWPALLIAVGLVQILDRRSSRFGPMILMIAGAALLLSELGYIDDFSLGDLIPVGVALLGAKLIWEAVGRRRPPADAAGDPDSTVHSFAIMAGVHHQSTSQRFRGGDANAIMGGVELDLRQAQIVKGELPIIDAFAIWGAVEIFVPPNWRVVGNVFPLMGAFEDNSKHNGEPGPTLTIRGMALMGGIEVKN